MKKPLLLKTTAFFFIALFVMMLPGFAVDIIHGNDIISPRGMCYDAENNRVLFVDYASHGVFEIDVKTLKVKRIAGKIDAKDRYGIPLGGYVDGKIDEARFMNPSDVTILSDGAIVVADTGNHAIRKIYEGRVETIFGGKEEGKQAGSRNNAKLSYPTSVFAVGTTLYVSDTENKVIRRSNAGGSLEILKPEFQNPGGIFVDDQVIYLAEMQTNRILKVEKGRKVSEVAGDKNRKGNLDGFIDVASFFVPSDIAVEKGEIYVADTGNHAVRRIKKADKDHLVVETILGGEVGFHTENRDELLLDSPKGLTFAGKKLFVSDTGNSRILCMDDARKAEPVGYYEKCTDENSADIYINGRKVLYEDAKPIIENGTTYVPIRILIENVGGTVKWNPADRTVTCIFRDQKAVLKEELKYIKDRTYLPLRKVAELLGMEVEWDGDLRIIKITTY